MAREIDARVVKEFLSTPRGATLKKVAAVAYNGKPVADLRDHYLPNETTEYLPGKGITLWLESEDGLLSEAKEFHAALGKLIDEWDSGELRRLFKEKLG